MSDTTRKALAELLAEHWWGDNSCGVCECGEEFGHWDDWSSHINDLISADFLVVPRSDFTTEYGWQYFHNGQWETVETEDRQQAIDNAAYQRDCEGEEWPTPARAVEHLTTSWSVIPLPKDGGTHAR